MYYLILKDIVGDIKIIGNCETSPHKSVIIKNYCLNNDINLVTCRQDINEQCEGTDQMYTYPILDNRYMILKCTKHEKNVIFSDYVEKYTEGYFEFHFYKPEEMKLRKLEIEETLINDEMDKQTRYDYNKQNSKQYI